ncbi:hypothetical protein N9P30_02295 [Alphaproteobacteria bacterium]|nr:hypothetical protein [Alphaproteobacteria bacterium]
MTLRDFGDSVKNLAASAKDTSDHFGDVISFNVNWLDAPIWMLALAIPMLFFGIVGVFSILTFLFRSLVVSNYESDDNEDEFFIDITNPRWHRASLTKRVLLVTIYGTLGLLIAPIIIGIITTILALIGVIT